MSDDEGDEYDNIPDEFADAQGVDWDELLSCPPQLTQTSNSEVPLTELPTEANQPVPASHQQPEAVPERLSAPSPDASSHYSWDQDINDPSFLSELDALENNQFQQVKPKAGAVAENDKTLDKLTAKRLSLKRGHSPILEEAEPSKRKGKAKASDSDLLWHVFAEFEEELTCPICSDLLVATHVGNPCGHSFCGDCGWQWKMKKKTSCVVCRTELANPMPLIPNYAMDSMVQKHIQMLILAGHAEWEPGGPKDRDYMQRKETWIRDAPKRAKESSKAGRRPTTRHLIDLADFIVDDHVDEDDEIEFRPSRRPRRVRS